MPPKEPPDGRWGWAVCFACALSNIITPPVILCFGLILQHVSEEQHISNVGEMLILNLNHAFGLLVSVYDKRFIKSYGYRKVAVVGSMIVPIGVLLTSGVTSTISYIITFGLFTCMGMYTLPNAFNVALLSFFTTKRQMAVNIALFFGCLGPVFMPHLMQELISKYGHKEAMMLLSALMLNSMVAACLLRPIKKNLISIQDVTTDKNGTLKSNIPLVDVDLRENDDSGEYFSESENDYLEKISTQSFEDTLNKEVEKHPNATNVLQKPYRWWSHNSIEVNLQSSLDIFHSRENESMKIEPVQELPQSNIEPCNIDTVVTHHAAGQCLKKIRAINIIAGLSLARSAEISFSLLIPFMMRDLKIDTFHIATFMTVINASEFIFKFTSPLIGDWCSKSARIMFYMSLWMLIFSRMFFVLTSTYESLLLVAIAYGIARGVNSIYINLVVPNYRTKGKAFTTTSTEKIASAILVTLFGLTIGYIREYYDTHWIPVIFVNIITMITIVLWSLEYLLM